MAAKLVYILGDIHADFAKLNYFIDKRIRMDRALRQAASEGPVEVAILQCGDFGFFWPRLENKGAIENHVGFLGGRIPIYWCGGNHEDWDRLDKYQEMAEIDNGIFYCPFGTTLDLSPDIRVLFAGGAESQDKEWRIDEMRKKRIKIWWEQEGISESDLDRLDSVPRADWVISHTAPNAFDVAGPGIGGPFAPSYPSPSRGKLEHIKWKYAPKRWFFGHFHFYNRGRVDGCDWTCLASIGSGDLFWAKEYIDGQS